ncbi:MAG TPA: tetratricopeptide repeat protein [Syntrophales bacterium]|nr:tetratricopeptide repeat protein [Syntrophales bacterium]
MKKISRTAITPLRSSEKPLISVRQMKDIEDNPDNPATHHYLSCSYLDRGMFQETIEHGLKAISLAEAGGKQDMMFLWTRYNLSLAYYRLGDPKAARDMATQALTKYPDHIDSHFMMIVICFDEKRWKDLVYHAECYLRLLDVLNTDPPHFGTLMTCSYNEEWNVHVLLGIAHAELGQEVNSQKSFDKAIRYAPEQFIALRAIGIYFYNKNHVVKSRIYLDKAHQQNSNDETVNNLLNKLSNMKEPTISCCMIVKNEESFLENCLKSVINYVNEIIIVDTGSTDETVHIAKKFTDRVYFHPWEGSFSKARNQSLQYATCDWIFIIDGDEELVVGSGEKLLQAVREAGKADAIHINTISIYSGGKKTARHNSERLFRNNGVIHYEGIVHNRVIGQTCNKHSTIELMHYGYNVEEKKAVEKYIRTTELLKHQLRETPDNPMLHHYLGASHLARAMYRECANESVLAIELAEKQGSTDPIYLWTCHNAAISFFHLGDLKRARDYASLALKKCPDHLDSTYIMSVISAEEKQWNDVLHYGLHFLELRDYFENNPDKPGLIINNHLSEGGNINLLVGHAYHALKNYESMDKHYRVAYQMSDDKSQIWRDIGTLHMDRSGDLGLARKYLDLALEEAPDDPSVWYMLAKWNSKTENESDEKRCLERLLELGSQDIMVLNRLATLSMASDNLTMAHKALEALIKIDPQNHSALCNLGLLHRRQNHLDRAMESFSKAIEINPQEAAPWLHLGEIALQLGQCDNARLFFERVHNLGKGMLKSLLYLCEIELRQKRMVDFIGWCDLILKELRLNRTRTIDKVEDISGILYEINVALIHDSALSAQVSNLFSLLPSGRD